MLLAPVYKAARKVYRSIGKPTSMEKFACVNDPDLASDIIAEAILSPDPLMIARMGSTEMNCIVNYLGVKKVLDKDLFSYLKGDGLGWWWNKGVIENMYNLSGVFPMKEDIMERFSEKMLEDIKLVDILGSWLPYERIFEKELSSAIKIERELLNPFFSKNPWTLNLATKKVLVIHPFSGTIEMQYKKRTGLFNMPVLPDFKLIAYPCIQSVAGVETPYKDWFEALAVMEKDISGIDFDVALIAGGAYGFPLAAYIKRMGKKAIHIGGSLQLFFGIIGKRWEDPNYNKKYPYYSLINDNWVRPNVNEKPSNSNIVEGSCYW